MTAANRIDVVMPDLGVANARVTVWYAAPGDHVYQGDRLVEISVAGATVDIPSPVAGYVLAQLVFARDLLRSGQVLGSIAADAEQFMAGFFLSLDGLDGTGKSTQLHQLAAWLRERSHDVVTCHDPGGTPLGDHLRALVLGKQHSMSLACEAFLFMASRAELVQQIIRPALADGKTVLSDRFLLANVVYQGHAGGLAPHDLWALGRIATGGLEPDLTIVLDLPVEQALSRRGRPADRMEDRDLSYHERVRAGFRAEVERRPDRHLLIDASPDAGRVQAAIRDAVTARLLS